MPDFTEVKVGSWVRCRITWQLIRYNEQAPRNQDIFNFTEGVLYQVYVVCRCMVDNKLEGALIKDDSGKIASLHLAELEHHFDLVSEPSNVISVSDFVKLSPDVKLGMKLRCLETYEFEVTRTRNNLPANRAISKFIQGVEYDIHSVLTDSVTKELSAVLIKDDSGQVTYIGLSEINSHFEIVSEPRYGPLHGKALCNFYNVKPDSILRCIDDFTKFHGHNDLVADFTKGYTYVVCNTWTGDFNRIMSLSMRDNRGHEARINIDDLQAHFETALRDPVTLNDNTHVRCIMSKGLAGDFTLGRDYLISEVDRNYPALRIKIQDNDDDTTVFVGVTEFLRFFEIVESIPDVETANSESPVFEFDEILKASHYNQSSIECIDAIEAASTPEEFAGALKFQIMKYLWRCNYKDSAVKDIKKAKYYLDKLVSLLEKRDATNTTDKH